MINFKKSFRQRPWLFIIIIIYTAGMITVSIPKSMEITEDSDHWIIWQAGKDFSHGEELYYRDKFRPFPYPPFTAFVSQPLQLLPLKYSALVLFLLNSLVLLPMAIYLIYRCLIMIGLDQKKVRTSLILVTLFSLKYFWNNLVMFQVNMILFVVILLGIYYLAKKKPHLAGILFTLITFFKIIPVFLAAYVFLFHFSKRVVLSMVLTASICLVLPMAFRGSSQWVSDHVEYYETFLGKYISEGRIVTTPVNHSLKAGLVKTFHPESRDSVHIYPEDYPVTSRIGSMLQVLLLLILVINGIRLYHRKIPFSIAYLSSIILFTHLYAGITWTAHLVTLMFWILPVVLIDPAKLRKGGRIMFYLIISLLVFLGIEGSDTVGRQIYLAIRYYDVFTILMLGTFLFCSWIVWFNKSGKIYPEAMLASQAV